MERSNIGTKRLKNSFTILRSPFPYMGGGWAREKLTGEGKKTLLLDRTVVADKLNKFKARYSTFQLFLKNKLNANLSSGLLTEGVRTQSRFDTTEAVARPVNTAGPAACVALLEVAGSVRGISTRRKTLVCLDLGARTPDGQN